MIQPTPGRIVWYYPDSSDKGGGNEPPMKVLSAPAGGDMPLTAQIVAVHGDRMVNLVVFDAVGFHFRRLSVQLLQDDDAVPGSRHATWMPYQKGQAANAIASSAIPITKKKAEIARVCHEVNRAYCQALGDSSQPAWEDAPEWQKNSAMLGVELHLNNPHAGPQASHVSWMRQKEEEGWVWGPVKDAEKKTHPCIVDFSDLPREQQAKDFIFRAVVHALAG